MPPKRPADADTASLQSSSDVPPPVIISPKSGWKKFASFIPSPFAHPRQARPSSFMGPLSREAQAKAHGHPPSFSLASLESSLAHAQIDDASAIERVQEIGKDAARPYKFDGSQPAVQLSLGNVSVSGSSYASSVGSARGRGKVRSPSYQKKHHIFYDEHREKNVRDLRSNIIRMVKMANQARLRTKHQPLEGKGITDLLMKANRVRRFIEGPRQVPDEVFMSEYLDNFLQKEAVRQREADALSLLPLPKGKLHELERLKREERARKRKWLGVLGRPPLPSRLDDEAEDEVDQVFRKPGRIATIAGAEVNDKDIRKLLPGQWLNDEVINFYGNLILIRANQAEKERDEAIKAAKESGDANKLKKPYDTKLDAFWRVHFFSSFFWENLKNRGFDGVKRWTRRVDIFTRDIVLFPINLGNQHWVCGAINMRKRRFEYYDSMGQMNAGAFKLMRTYLAAEAQDKKKKKLDLSTWQDWFSRETPQQENGHDCGVFASMTLEQISRRDPRKPIPGPIKMTWAEEDGDLDEKASKMGIDDEAPEDYEWNFSQSNMSYIRRRMVYEIASSQLLD